MTTGIPTNKDKKFILFDFNKFVLFPSFASQVLLSYKKTIHTTINKVPIRKTKAYCCICPDCNPRMQ